MPQIALKVLVFLLSHLLGFLFPKVSLPPPLEDFPVPKAGILSLLEDFLMLEAALLSPLEGFPVPMVALQFLPPRSIKDLQSVEITSPDFGLHLEKRTTQEVHLKGLVLVVESIDSILMLTEDIHPLSCSKIFLIHHGSFKIDFSHIASCPIDRLHVGLSVVYSTSLLLVRPFSPEFLCQFIIFFDMKYPDGALSCKRSKIVSNSRNKQCVGLSLGYQRA